MALQTLAFEGGGMLAKGIGSQFFGGSSRLLGSEAAFVGSEAGIGFSGRYGPQVMSSGSSLLPRGGISDLYNLGDAAFNETNLGQLARTPIMMPMTGGSGLDMIPAGQRMILRPIEIQFPAQGLSSTQQLRFSTHLFECQ